MSRKDILCRVRTQVMLVRRLNGQIREVSADGLRSLRLDGAPRKTSGIYRGLDVRMEKKEAMERMLRRESEILRQYEREARREMDGMKPEHYAFCAMYYIGGFSLEETAEALERSARQCARYKHEIEAA
ncbi:MAG: hypothetical protein E7321_03455 [Clostridiales bacterium]|nr:hypothetical protein [Clostridiales bacterium]